MRYRLMTTQGTADSVPIKQGRRYVGSVRPAESGSGWVGRISGHAAIGATPEIAFREVAARAMGFANLAALRAHNARARASNNAARASTRFRASIRAFANRPPEPVDDEPF